MFSTNSIGRNDIMDAGLFIGIFCLFVMYWIFQAQQKETRRILANADNREAVLLRTLDVTMDIIDESNETEEKENKEKTS